MKRFAAFFTVLLFLALPVFSAGVKSVVFRFCPTEEHLEMGIENVFLAGTFNGWNPGPKMKQDEETGKFHQALKMVKKGNCYELTVRLEPGEYPYKFVINSVNWITDEQAGKFVEDGFGGKNSVKVVQ